MKARLLHLFAGAVIAVAATSGVALATGGSLLGPDGRITACVHGNSGNVRIVGDGNCRQAEQSLAWNQSGPSGPQGPQGERGPVGESPNACELERRIAAALPGFVATTGCVPAGPPSGPPTATCDDGDPTTIDRGTPPNCTHEPIGPAPAEVCNGIDDDRDGSIDEHAPVPNLLAFRCGSNGEWLVAACVPYWHDSNGTFADGCERRLLFEPNHDEASATPIPSSGTISAEILPTGDIDVFRYTLSCTFFRPCRPHVQVTAGAFFDVSGGGTFAQRQTSWDATFTSSTTLFLSVYAGSGETPEFTLTETH